MILIEFLNILTYLAGGTGIVCGILQMTGVTAGYLQIFAFAAVYGISSLLKQKNIRCGLLVLCAVVLCLLNEATPDRILYLVTGILLSAGLLKDAVSPDILQQKTLLKYCSILYGGVIVLLWLASETAAVTQRIMPCFLIMWISSVLLLRSLRHDREVWQAASFQIRNLIAVAALTAAAFLLSTEPVMNALKAGIAWFGEFILAPAATGTLYVLFLPVMFIISLIQVDPDAGTNVMDVFEENMHGIEDALPTHYARESAAPIVTRVLTGLIVIAAVIILFAVIRRILKSNSRRRNAYFSAGVQRTAISEAEEKRAPVFDSTPEAGVRKQYRKFLRLAADKGFFYGPSETTESILKDSGRDFPGEQLKELTDLYRRARYGEEADSEDVQRAKQLYREIRSGR